MSDERDPPIEEPGFIAGVTVIDFGDVRVARGLTRRSSSSCPHRRLMYDSNERRIWCKDCEHDVEPFDAFKKIVENYDSSYKQIVRREEQLAEAERFKIRSIAAKKMDEAWRSREMIPSCPHCHRGLFPEDFKHGVGMIGKDFATRRATTDASPKGDGNG